VNEEENEVSETEAEVIDLEQIKLSEISTGDVKDERIAELERELEDWRARAYRSAADMENLRKRFQRERDDLRKFGVEGLVKDLLTVVDNLERAIGHAEPDNRLAEGVDMVLRQFVQVAAKHGAEPFDVAGQPFDPQIHEAMSQVPTNDVEPGTVVDVYQRGWNLHGRLVRPAMVTVSSPGPKEEPKNDAEIVDESNDVDVDGQDGQNDG
jgi:molecular chaperone GrpE